MEFLEEGQDTKLGVSRRDVMKRGAMVGGAVLWATPVVQSLNTPAFAQTVYGCPCNARACALRISGLINLEACGTPECVATASATASGVVGGTANATVLCATFESQAGANNACDASASVATLDISGLTVAGLVGPLAIHATVLTSSVSAPCDCGPATTGGDIATLTIQGINALTLQGRATLSALGILVAIGEVTCQGGVTTRRALHINVLGLLDVVVAEASAGAPNCPCPTGP